MGTLIVWLVLIGGLLFLASRIKAPPSVWTAIIGGGLLVAWLAGALTGGIALLLGVVFIALAVLLNVPDLRQRFVSAPMLARIRAVLPPISDTEREAIEAGTVWWDAELFRGQPDWSVLHAVPEARLTDEERAFMDGPVETLCEMLDDWEITHELNDLPDNVWQYMKDQRFFGLNIPQSYGGLDFSPHANSEIVMKVCSRSGTAGVTVMVPNSLGPAELLLHYGTEEQKDHYLPRLARGDDIPCFGLTGPWAGSDAGAMTDYGVVCRETIDGQSVLGFRVSWEKRYITLGPVASILGLAFKAFDPDHLLGDEEELGITCALVPVNTPGVTIGQRHMPMNSAFMNGPNSGDAVFIPFDWIIGGQDCIGRGWRMLMESLAAGRGISLPASGVSASKVAARSTGAYARVREQFGVAIGKFEGIEEALARIAGLTYMMDAARRLTTAGLVQGEKPSVVSAIVKYELTDNARTVVNDAMDVHGGRGICLGPNNYLGRAHQQVPIGITVEGANILTRCLIIFGQGAMRCHPYLLQEVAAASDADKKRALTTFDGLLVSHIGYVLGNAARALLSGLSGGRLTKSAGGAPEVARYYRSLSRYSAAFALMADVTLLILGGALKRREKLSGRFADALSSMYLGSATLKRFEDTGRPAEDLPMVHWAMQHSLYRIQDSLHGILKNYPVAPIGWLLRLLVFPLGRHQDQPSDRLGRELATILMTPGAARDRLTESMYLNEDPSDILGKLEAGLHAVVDTDSLRRRLRKQEHRPKEGQDYAAWVEELQHSEAINQDEASQLLHLRDITRDVIDVDAFEPEEVAGMRQPAPRRAVA